MIIISKTVLYTIDVKTLNEVSLPINVFVILWVSWGKTHQMQVPFPWIYDQSMDIQHIHGKSMKSLLDVTLYLRPLWIRLLLFLPPLSTRSLPLLTIHWAALSRHCGFAWLWMLIAIDEIIGQSGVLSWFFPLWRAIEHSASALTHAHLCVEHQVFWSRQLQ